jgi:hypothetical protein
MDKQKIIAIINDLKQEYTSKSSDMLTKIGKAVILNDAQSVSEDVLTATRYEAKADVLEELLEKIEEI